jgi:Ca2+-binding RTX toxin-like protein
MVHPGRAATVVVAALTALVLAAAPASAIVSVNVDVDTVEITSNSASDTITVTCAGGVVNVGMTPTDPQLTCDGLVSLVVDANSGSDNVDLSGVTLADFPEFSDASVDVGDAFADSVEGSEGRDVINADQRDSIDAGAGDDWVEGAKSVSGGPGDDTLREISSLVDGGPGDDRIVAPGDGPIDGGDGYDVLVQDYTSFPEPQQVTLVITDTFLGPAPGFGIPSTGIERYELTTSTGFENDSIDSSAYSGVVNVNTVDGNDTVRGGRGADVVDGGAGNDVLNPGPGADVVRGGSGNDTITVRDGVADSVDCGSGTDTVVADRVDVLTGCEKVSLPPPDTYPIVGPKKVTKGKKKPSFTFGSPAAGAQFQCSVDGGAFKACESPFRIKVHKLKPGKHLLAVRAVQPAGNADPSPSTFKFKVKPKPKK